MSKPTTPIKRRERPIQHKAAAKPQTTPIRVRATRLGYYDEKRRRAGDVFTFQAPVVEGAALLPSWLEEATAAPLKETGAQAALNDAAADVRAMSGQAASAPTASGDDLGI